MQKSEVPTDESRRQKVLRALEILDTPIEERFERITRAARQLTGLPIAGLSFADGARLWFKSLQGLDAVQETSRDGSLCARAVAGTGVCEVRDARKDEELARHDLVFGEPWIRFYAGHPIRTHEGVNVGALFVADRKPRKLSERQATVLASLARAAEAELCESRAKAQRELAADLRYDRRSAIDSVTRLWGREAILDILEREFQRARKNGLGIGTIIVDVDPLQQLGETRGFEATDALARRAARRLVRSLRPQDSVGRFGGNEFLGVITTTDRAELAALAQKMRMKITRRPMPAPGGGSVEVTVSLGAAWAPANGLRTPGALLDAASDALCNARLRGGNRVEVRAA